MTISNRISEDEVAAATVKYLRDAGGTATIGQIRRALPHYIELGSNDRQPSPTRPGEELWEQQVRNLVCHRDVKGNPVNAGRLRYSPRRLSLAVRIQLDLFANDNDDDE
jgi:hypothetical protein